MNKRKRMSRMLISAVSAVMIVFQSVSPAVYAAQDEPVYVQAASDNPQKIGDYLKKINFMKTSASTMELTLDTDYSQYPEETNETDIIYSSRNNIQEGKILITSFSKTGTVSFDYLYTNTKDFAFSIKNFNDYVVNLEDDSTNGQEIENTGQPNTWHHCDISYTAMKAITIEYSDKSVEKTGFIAIRNFTYSDTKFSVNIKSADGGTITGDNVVEGKIENLEKYANENISITAVPDTGYTFAGWYDENNTLVAKEAKLDKKVTKDLNLTAHFLNIQNAEVLYRPEDWNLEETKTYSTLDEALQSGLKPGSLTLLQDLSINKEVTIPEGIELLVPYSSLDFNGENSPTELIGTHTLKSSWNDGTEAYRTLTIETEGKLNILGKIIVGGVRHCSSQAASGHTCGDYAKVVNNGQINLSSQAEMDVSGYVTGSGILNCLNESTLKMPFVINDFAGGNNTAQTFLAGDFPFKQYSLPNVDCPIEIKYGSTLIGKASLYFSGQANTSQMNIVGTSNALINLKPDSSLSIIYNPNKKIDGISAERSLTEFGKHTFTILGNASMGNFTIEGYTTSGLYIYLPYNFDFEVKKGTFVIPNGSALRIMPGASVSIGQEAVLSIEDGGKLDVPDGWQQSVLSKTQYPLSSLLESNGFSKSGALIINGELNIEDGGSFTGIVQAHQAEGQINVSQEAVLTQTYNVGADTGANYGNNKASYSNSARIYDGSHLADIEKGTSYVSIDASEWTLDKFTMTGNGLTQDSVQINQIMKGNWVIPKVTYHFKGNGQEDQSKFIKPGLLIDLTEPEWEGYTFTGWYTSEDCQEDSKVQGEYTMPRKNVDLYAGWRIKTYKVAFDPGEGTFTDPEAGKEQSVEYGQTVQLPEVTREGYIFAGWKDQDNSAFNGQSKVTKNLQLTAQWTESDFTITYELNDGHWKETTQDSEHPGKYTITTDTFTLPEPEKAGYEFSGWTRNQGEIENPGRVEKGTHENLTFSANWRPHEHQFKVEGVEESSKSETKKFNDPLQLPQDPVKEGYRFNGWKIIGSNGTDYHQTLPETMPDEDLTLTAQWTSYLALLQDMEDFEGERLATAKDYYKKLTEEQKKDYDTSDLIQAQIIKALPGVNKKLTESEERIATVSLPEQPSVSSKSILVKIENPRIKAAKMLTISFLSDLFGCEEVDSLLIEGQHVNKDQFSIMLQVAYAALHEQQGIEDLSAFTNWLQQNKDGLTIECLVGTTITVQLSDGYGHGPTYNVSFYDDTHQPGTTVTGTLHFSTGEDASNIGDITAKPGTPLNQPDNPTRTGYSFGGWYKEAQCQTEFDFSGKVMKEGEKTLYAKWDPIHYNVTFEPGFDNDGSIGSMKSLNDLAYDAKVSLSECGFTRTGYHFTGWKVGMSEKIIADQGMVEKLTSTDKETVVLTAQWEANTYKVTLDAQGGTIPNDLDHIDVTYGQSFAALPIPTRQGYDFNGWFDGNTPYNQETKVKITGDIKLKASWTAKGSTKYTIKYYQEKLDSDEYELVDTVIKQGQTDAAATAEQPEVEGFEIDSSMSRLSGNIEADESLVLNIYYKRKVFDVTFDINGTFEKKQLKYGTLVSHETPILEESDYAGYEFTGWQPELGEVKDNVVYQAQFDIIQQAKIDETAYRTLAIALKYAKPKDIVTLTGDIDLTEDISVPADVTLLISCMDNDPGYVDTKDGLYNPDGDKTVSGKTGPSKEAKCYQTLHVQPDVHINIEGTLLVNAVTGRPHAGHYDQDTTGGYGQINLEADSSIEVENGGILDICGYVKGTGTITAKPGGEVRDLYVVKNWRGGSQAWEMFPSVYPMNEAEMHHIEVPTIIEAGGSLVGTVKMYASDSYYRTRFPQVDPDNGLIRQSEGSVVKTFENGKEKLQLIGSGSIESSTLTIVGMPLSTNGFLYPIDGDMNITFAGGTWNVNERIKIMPGTEIYLIDGAKLITSEKTASSKARNETVLYDSFQPSDPANTDGTQYPADREASFIELQAGTSAEINDAFGGLIRIDPNASRTNPVNLTLGWSALMEVQTKEANGYGPDHPSQALRTLTFNMQISGWDQALEPGKAYSFYYEDGVLKAEITDIEKPVEPTPPAPVTPSPGSGSGTGAGGGGGSAVTPQEPAAPSTTTNPDGSTTTTTTDSAGNKTTTTEKTDGSTEVVEEKTDGSTVTTTTKADGSSEKVEEKADGSTTTTVVNTDGSSEKVEEHVDGSKTTTTDDGAGTTQIKEEKVDGSVETTTNKADGSVEKIEESADKLTTTTTNTDPEGTISAVVENKSADGSTSQVSGSITVSEQSLNSAQTAGSNVTITMPEIPADHVGNDVQLEVVIPESAKSATLEIPVDSATIEPGSVAMIEDEEGNLIPIVESIGKDGKLIVPLSKNCKIVIKDNKKNFADVTGPTSDYPANGIAFLSARNLMTGVGDGTSFDLTGKVTRAQLATILYRQKGEPDTSFMTLPQGVNEGEYFTKAAKWATSTGLMGVGSNFNAGDLLTREQLAMILWRVEGRPNDYSLDFSKYSDSSSISTPEMQKAVGWAVKSGLMGKGTSKLNASGSSQRQELAAMLSRYLSK